MAQYKVEFVRFTQITIEADNETQATDIAATMEDEKIEALAKLKPEYIIWDIRRQ